MDFSVKAAGIAVVLTLVACSSDSSKMEQKPTSEVAVDYKERLTEYKNFVEGLDKTKVESSTIAAKKYSELFKGADPEICDQAYAMFQDLYEGIGFKLNEKISKDTAIQNSTCAYKDENGREIPPSKALRKFESQIVKHGFDIECQEGMPSLGLDYAFIERNFYKSVSPVMRKFLKGLKEDDDKELSIDAGIILSEKDFVDRTVWWENFVKENPDFILIERAKALKQAFFTDLIYGMNNTPAIAYMSTGGEESISDLSAYFVTAYTYLNKKYPDSETNKLIQPFFKAAKARDFQKVDQIRKDYTKKGYMVDFEKETKLYL